MKIASVCSGVGTPELALKKAGIEFDILFACELDKWARTTYLENNKAPGAFYEDLTELDATKYKNEIDMIVGGTPCQSFSIAGKRGGFKDTRGTLFFDFARILKETKAKAFIFENVKGLVNHDKGRTFSTIKNTFENLGYRIFYQILNTKDYGIPQNRERIYIVGFLDHSVKFQFGEKQQLKLCLEDMLEENVVDEKYYVKTGTASKNQGNGHVSILQKARGYNKGGEHTLCPTISSNSWQENNILQTNYTLRKLTPRECFNLQGFSKNFKFPMWGKRKMSDTQLYKQAGNAMSQNVIEIILREVIKCLKK